MGRALSMHERLKSARRSPQNVAAWILAHATYSGAECLWWPFYKGSNGYGTITMGNRPLFAHRVVCELVHGAPPFPEAQARHTCGKGKQGCIHPKHIVWGSAAENQADRRVHGTAMFAESHPNAVLTTSDVIAIRNRHLSGESNTELAKAFGVHRTTIARAVSRKNWRDV